MEYCETGGIGKVDVELKGEMIDRQIDKRRIDDKQGMQTLNIKNQF